MLKASSNTFILLVLFQTTIISCTDNTAGPDKAPSPEVNATIQGDSGSVEDFGINNERDKGLEESGDIVQSSLKAVYWRGSWRAQISFTNISNDYVDIPLTPIGVLVKNENVIRPRGLERINAPNKTFSLGPDETIILRLSIPKGLLFRGRHTVEVLFDSKFKYLTPAPAEFQVEN